MCSHAETFQEGDLKKLAASHEIYAKSEQYTSSDVDYAEVCIEHGIC
jgi:hypothetical protein